MALALCAILVALPCLSHATAPNCEDLVKPIMPDPSQVQFLVFFPFISVRTVRQKLKVRLRIKVFGRWVYAMGAGDPQTYHKALESMKNSWIELSPTDDPRVVTLRWGDRCLWVKFTVRNAEKRVVCGTVCESHTLSRLSSDRCIFGEVNATVSGLATTFRSKWAVRPNKCEAG